MLLAHLVASAVLAGVGWVVQVVVYPAFALVGPGEWARYHARHLRAMTRVVVGPWLVQGATTVGLLLTPDRGTLALAALAAAGVGATVLAALPAHARLADGPDPAGVATLLRANLVRTLAWTASTALAAWLVVRGA